VETLATSQGGIPSLKPDEDPTENITGLYISQVIQVFPETYTVRTRDRRGITKAKVLTSRSSRKDGDFDLPRVGEFVLLAYVEGQVSEPVVLGSFFPVNSFLTTDNPKAQKRRIRRVKTHIKGDQVVEDAIIEYIETKTGDITINVTAMEQGTGNITVNLTGNAQSDGNLRATISGEVELNVQGEVNFNFDKKWIATVLEKIIFNNSDMRFGGEDADQQLVLGNIWQQIYNKFITLFNSHLHIGNLGSVTSPPTKPAEPLTGSELSDIARTKKG
jgi:Type VI secretion system/phage-baseplate injector OB domain